MFVHISLCRYDTYEANMTKYITQTFIIQMCFFKIYLSNKYNGIVPLPLGYHRNLFLDHLVIVPGERRLQCTVRQDACPLRHYFVLWYKAFPPVEASHDANIFNMGNYTLCRYCMLVQFQTTVQLQFLIFKLGISSVQIYL